jgi:hypothetical protein
VRWGLASPDLGVWVFVNLKWGMVIQLGIWGVSVLHGLGACGPCLSPIRGLLGNREGEGVSLFVYFHRSHALFVEEIV